MLSQHIITTDKTLKINTILTEIIIIITKNAKSAI